MPVLTEPSSHRPEQQSETWNRPASVLQLPPGGTQLLPESGAAPESTGVEASTIGVWPEQPASATAEMSRNVDRMRSAVAFNCTPSARARKAARMPRDEDDAGNSRRTKPRFAPLRDWLAEAQSQVDCVGVARSPPLQACVVMVVARPGPGRSRLSARRPGRAPRRRRCTRTRDRASCRDPSSRRAASSECARRSRQSDGRARPRRRAR